MSRGHQHRLVISRIHVRALTKQVGGSVGIFGFGGKASTVFGKATSTGTTEINTKAESSGSDNRKLEARYQQYIRVSRKHCIYDDLKARVERASV